jgi:polysaccharide biosynthesis protein PslJ
MPGPVPGPGPVPEAGSSLPTVQEHHDHRLPPSVAAIGACLALLSADVVAGAGQAQVIAAALLAVVFAILVARLARSWLVLVSAMLLVALLIPSNGTYVLPEGLPFQLEPYRVVIGFLLIGWIIALLVDPRVRARATGFEGPLILIVGATLGSDFVNPGRAGTLSSFVVKALWLFACFVLFAYLVVSVVRTRAVVERLITVLVSGGSFVAFGAVVQRRSGFNLFDHLHVVLPVFNYNPLAVVALEERGGNLRAFASAGHPIELSTVMAMLVPLAIYLAISRRRRAWWLSVTVLLLADFAGGSRTGVIGLVVMLVVFLWLRPRQTLRCWPAVFPLLVILHFSSPGAIGGVIEGFFPKGGVVAQQSETYIGPGGKVEYANRLSRVGPELHEFSEHNPLLGIGYGTRVVGKASIADNAIILDDQWLDTLLETGVLGVLGWLSLFALVIRRLGVRAKLERDTPEGWLPVALTASVATFACSMFFYDAFSFDQGTCLAFAILGLSAVVLRIPARVTSTATAGHADRARGRARSVPAAELRPQGA